MQIRFHLAGKLLIASLAAAVPGLFAQPAAGPALAGALNRAQKEAFLLKAKIVKTQSANKGVTNTLRATLSDGTIAHDASIQRIDDTKRNYDTPYGTELIFRDSWKYNVAAYRLDKLLGLNMVPVSVARNYSGSPGSFTWWIEDVMMDEETRQKQKTQSPDQDSWNRQMHIVHVFDNLIYNIDENMTNILIDKGWQIWMIDHSRGFRSNPNLLDEKLLVRCDSDMLAKMKLLDLPTLQRELGDYVEPDRIKALLTRRDKIVKFFEAKGDSALFSIPRRPE